MPVRQFQQRQSSEHEALADELAEEWLAPQSSKSEPVILEQTVPGQGLAHVYVVWGKWAHLDLTKRSEIIMEAAERKFTGEEVDRISLALGLTPEQADRQGIVWR
jgi:hypothetical protein